MGISWKTDLWSIPQFCAAMITVLLCPISKLAQGCCTRVCRPPAAPRPQIMRVSVKALCHQVAVLCDPPVYLKPKGWYLHSLWIWYNEWNMWKKHMFFAELLLFLHKQNCCKIAVFLENCLPLKKLQIIFFSSMWDVFTETFEADSHFFWVYFYSIWIIIDHMA